MPDLVFNKYEIIRRLAVGGMGEIFLARQHGIPGFDRLVILKNLLPELASQQGFIDQFLDEARVAATLNHPNIVAIYEVGKWEGVYFIAMEYIHGVSISDLMIELVKRDAVVPPPVAARIIMDAAVGLDHAHHARDTQGNELNIVHRDISPQNIMVRKDGVTKVVDFGIAKAANRSVRTTTGQVKGKLGYMSPEQVGERPLDGRTDQFALGVVFWEMCTGRRLMGSSNVAITINRILNEPIPPVSNEIEGFPPALDEVMGKMLHKTRERRYSRCLEAAQDLKAYLDTVSGEIGQVDVARLLESILGQKIDETTRDLTPTGDNFLISLKENETADITTGKVERPRRGLAAASLLVVAVAAAAAWYVGDRLGDPQATTEVAAAAGTNAPAPVEPVTAPEPPKGPPVLELVSEPPGAGVFAGTRVLGQTPARLTSLAANVEHVLTLEKRGYESAEVKVILEPGEERTEKVELSKKVVRRGSRSVAVRGPPPSSPRAPAANQPGHVTIQTKPYTMVYLRGQLLGETPLYNYQLPAGTHTLRLVNEREKIDETRKVTVKSNKVAKLKVDFRK